MIYQVVLVASAALLVGAHQGHDHGHDEARKTREGQLRAVVHLANPKGRDIHGNVTFTQLDNKVHVSGKIYGMPPGKYGFHIHKSADIANGCYVVDSETKDHPELSDENRRDHDLGGIEFDSEKLSSIDFEDKDIALTGDHTIIGKAIVLHEMEREDSGIGHKRAACGVIEVL